MPVPIDSAVPVELIDPLEFRRVLGHYPSGVVAVTAVRPDGSPVGMTVSSFTSVSLDPPLVSFFPMKTSSTWPVIRESGSFCVNVLGAQQQSVCRALAMRGEGKFQQVEWRLNDHGQPAIAGAVARIDCDIEAVYDGGDHDIVLGRVRRLESEDAAPLLFFRGGYGSFLSSSITAVTESDLIEHLLIAERMRPTLLEASREIEAEIFVTGVASDQLVVIATSGHPDPQRLPTQVGLRMPFIPPLGGTVAAFDDPDAWLARGDLPDTLKERYRDALRATRERGWSATLATAGSEELDRALVLEPGDPAESAEAFRHVVEKLGADREWTDANAGPNIPVRSVTVPITQTDGRARLAVTAFGLPPSVDDSELQRVVHALRRVAMAASGQHESL